MKDFRAKLVSIKDLTSNVRQFVFKPDSGFDFEAGQFVMIDIADGQEPTASRAYSIASVPGGDEFYLMIKLLEDGRGSKFLNDLSERDVLDMKGPLGHFVLNKDSDKDLVFVATGTGVAPMYSMIGSLLKDGDYSRKMTLFFGLRHIKDVFWREEFEKLASKYENFDFKLTLSQPEDESWDGLTGRVTAILPEADFDFDRIQAYICGSKSMIDQVKKFFIDKGVPEDDIKNEVFWAF